MSSLSSGRLTRSTSRDASKASAGGPAIATTSLNRASSDSSNSDIKALLDKMLRSTDATTEHLKEEIFKSTESGVLRDLMKSSGSTASQIFESVLPPLNSTLLNDGKPQKGSSSDAISMLLKSGGGNINSELVDSVLFSNYLKSADRSKSTDTAFIRSVSSTIMNDKLPSHVFTSRDWMPQDVARHIDNDVVQKLMESKEKAAVAAAIGSGANGPAGKNAFPNFLATSGATSSSTGPTSAKKKASSSSKWFKVVDDALDLSGPSSGPPSPAKTPRAAAAAPSIQLAVSPPPSAKRELAHALVGLGGMPPLPTRPRGAVFGNTNIPKPAPPATGITAPSKKLTKKRKRKVHEPEEKIYVDITDTDVLLGRGGRVNHHPGNEAYLREKDRMQERYLAADKNEKTAISQELVDFVTGRGGRFLKQDPDSKDSWYVVLNITARKKASQTLREINTAEVRAAKRAKYSKKEDNKMVHVAHEAVHQTSV